MSSQGGKIGSELGGLIGAGLGGIFATVGAAIEGAVKGGAAGVAKHLETPQTPPPKSKLRDASPLSTTKHLETSQTPRPQLRDASPPSTEKQSPLAISTAQCAVSLVDKPPRYASGDAVTAPQWHAATLLHAAQVQGINHCIGCMPGQEKCRSLIQTAPGTLISNPFFEDAMLQIIHPEGRLEANGVDIQYVFPQVLSQMEVLLEGMECRVLKDELGPCIDMAVCGRYTQNGSAPRPVYVLSRCREHIASGGLRTAQMRWVFLPSHV